MKIVQVDWIDMTQSINWHYQDEVDAFVMDDKERLVHQVGYLYEEDENQVILLDCYFDDKHLYGNVHKIPRGCIVEIFELRKK